MVSNLIKTDRWPQTRTSVLRLRCAIAGMLHAIANNMELQDRIVFVDNSSNTSSSAPAKTLLGDPPVNPENALLWFEQPERTAFIAGFICAGGNVKNACSHADGYMGCLRFKRGTVKAD